MPQFLFAAKDGMGNIIQGTVTAVDMTDAVQQIAKMGYSLSQIQSVDDAPVSAPSSSATPAPTVTAPAAERTLASPPMPPQPSQTISDRSAAEPTQAMKPGPTAPAQDVLLADAAKRKKTEADLARLGMSPAEIQRLLNARATTFDPTPDSASGPIPSVTPTPTRTSGKRVTASSLEQFAAQLTTANAAKNKEAVAQVSLGLPEFREATMAETREAESLLREASALRRREKYPEAERKCREALQKTPRDAAALELLGDLLQGVARIDEALAAYRRAVEADPKRASAEKKYGDLLMRQQNWDFGDPEAAPTNPIANVLLSLFLPGTGQALNGEWPKAIAFFAIDLIGLYSLFLSPWAWTPATRLVGKQYSGSLNFGTPVILTVMVLLVTSFVASWDANLVARKRRLGE